MLHVYMCFCFKETKNLYIVVVMLLCVKIIKEHKKCDLINRLLHFNVHFQISDNTYIYIYFLFHFLTTRPV